MTNAKITDNKLDYVAGLLRLQIGIAQNLQSALENDEQDGGAVKNELQMLSRINRQIVSCHELLEWPSAREREPLAD